MACFLAHQLIASRFKKPYFALHVMHNAAIIYFSIGDALSALKDPLNANKCGGKYNDVFNGCASYMPLLINLSLHLYHPIAFGPLKPIDWIHHIPNYICTMLSFSFYWNGNLNLSVFALTGLPGGVDYVLLVCVGQGWQSRYSYKRWSARINVWLRAPLACATAYIGLASLAHQWAGTSWGQVAVTLLLNGHSLWNGPFFMRNTVEAFVVEVVNAHKLGGEERLSLGKVQKLQARFPRGGGKAAGGAAAAPTTRAGADTAEVPTKQGNLGRAGTQRSFEAYLPEGWKAVPSESHPGTTSYLNVHTGEKIGWVPSAPASREPGNVPPPSAEELAMLELEKAQASAAKKAN